MRRSGSPLSGISVVVAKEVADHFHSARMRFLEALILLAAVGAVYAATNQIRDTVGEDPFLLLRVFTTAREPLPSFVAFLGFLVPIIAIALGFDAINSEHNRGTLSRLLSQPIYRDALLIGKFLSGLVTLTIILTALWLLVTGLGILLLGLPPSAEEVVRSAAFLVTTIAYGGVWLALAILFSVVFRQPATSALAALALWLLFAVFWPMVSALLAEALRPEGAGFFEAAIGQARIEQAIARLSPNTLYGEATIALLNPSTRTLGPVFFSQLEGAVMGAPLPVVQSMLLIWPHLTGLVAATIVLFTIVYVTFQRQEVRA
jgi:ABC-2 type transport system permease protein